MRLHIVIIAVLLGLLLSAGVSASEPTTPLFDSQQALKTVLSAPISDVYAEKKAEVRPYHEGNFSYLDDSGATVRVPVRVKTRGNFRRLNCKMPPLRLNFSKRENKDNLLNGQNKLKLVAPCEKGLKFRQFIGLEYLAYQIYEELSPVHFRTRLVEISYLDTTKRLKPWTSYGFLIEDIKHVAKRINMRQIRASRVSKSRLDHQQTAVLELFQLLIGNTDFSTLLTNEGEACCHNTRILGPKGGVGKFVPVPYDFDVSGMVNAPYATPASVYPIETVRDRYYAGWCKGDEPVLAAIEHFKSKRDNIMALVDNAEILSDSSKKKTSRYLQKFFNMLDNPKRVEQQILGRCKGKRI